MQSTNIHPMRWIFEVEPIRKSCGVLTVNTRLMYRADHVDILGSSPLNAAILKIAAGRGDLVQNQIRSDILEYVEKMDWDL
jgi:hypothetical protein